MSPVEGGAGQHMREIAETLLLHEAAADGDAATNPPVCRVLEALRGPLRTLVGIQGCRVLLMRALNLAKATVPGLNSVSIRPDSSFAGLSNLSAEEGSAPGIAILAQLFGLLATFIGTALMLRILSSIWPQLTFPDTNGSGEQEI